MSEDAPTPADGATPPGRSSTRRLLRVLGLVLLIAVAIVVLFTWVFPWVEEVTQNPTLGVQLLRSPR
ncbi:MAG: hypothetical protein ACLFS9_06710 [Nitriliruptoraceae bacterium]